MIRNASGLSFDGWVASDGVTPVRFTIPDDFTPLPVSEPRTWLLREGWRKHGLIDLYETPGGSRH